MQTLQKRTLTIVNHLQQSNRNNVKRKDLREPALYRIELPAQRTAGFLGGRERSIETAFETQRTQYKCYVHIAALLFAAALCDWPCSALVRSSSPGAQLLRCNRPVGYVLWASVLTVVSRSLFFVSFAILRLSFPSLTSAIFPAFPHVRTCLDLDCLLAWTTATIVSPRLRPLNVLLAAICNFHWSTKFLAYRSEIFPVCFLFALAIDWLVH